MEAMLHKALIRAGKTLQTAGNIMRNWVLTLFENDL
jgi:hypothetical protein